MSQQTISSWIHSHGFQELARALRASRRAEVREYKPLKYLIADKTKPTIVEELQGVTDSFGEKVTLISNQMGIGSDQKGLSDFVRKEQPDGIFFRSDIQGLKNASFVHELRMTPSGHRLLLIKSSVH